MRGLWELLKSLNKGIPCHGLTRNFLVGRLGAILGGFWRRLWRVLGRPGGVLGHLGGVLGRLGGILGPSWGRLGASWERLGASWARLGSSFGRMSFF